MRSGLVPPEIEIEANWQVRRDIAAAFQLLVLGSARSRKRTHPGPSSHSTLAILDGFSQVRLPYNFVIAAAGTWRNLQSNSVPYAQT